MSETLKQIKRLHRRSGESFKERKRLFIRLDANERTQAYEDAIICGKSLEPFKCGETV